MKISLGLKIAGVVVILLVLVGSVSWINARSAKRVQSLIEHVHDFYVPAYGALARANIRSVEEGLLAHRLVIEHMRHPDDKTTTARFQKAIAEKSRQTGLEFNEARRLVQLAINDPANFEDKLDLTRLDTRLGFLQNRHA